MEEVIPFGYPTMTIRPYKKVYPLGIPSWPCGLTLLFEHLNVPTVKPIVESSVNDGETKTSTPKTHVEKLAAASDNMKHLYASICEFMESLGDDAVSNQLKLYLAYKKVQNMD